MVWAVRKTAPAGGQQSPIAKPIPPVTAISFTNPTGFSLISEASKFTPSSAPFAIEIKFDASSTWPC